MSDFISVIMPIYNEERYIDNCMKSLFQQDYPKDCMEWIFVDGGSKDKTKNILESYREKYPELIKILHNPDKTPPYAMNIGIENSSGEYIIRLDAHAVYPSDYISKCVYWLNNTDADNVGGYVVTKSKGFMGSCIASMLSSRFGVGGSNFRVNGDSGYVDTVPFGAFRRSVFDRIGLFNTQLPRSEDNEMNSRIREQGGKIYLAPDIFSEYYCRDSLSGILEMGAKNGNALFRTFKFNPKAMSLRHFIPFGFVLSLIALPLLGIKWRIFTYMLAVELAVYMLLDLYFSLSVKNKKQAIVLCWLYPLFHIVYGLGSLLGLTGINLY